MTGDIEFMSDYGAEMIFEISRFWVSVARLDLGARPTRLWT